MPKSLMQSVVSHLQKERTRLEDELHRVTAALTAFGKVYIQGSKLKAAVATRKKRTISAAGRKRITATQRARRAKIKGRKVFPIRSRKGRTMSPAARKRIVAAQKARWAKWRKAQKKALA
jgi:glutamate-1-semialdehyde aminotransferase